jgi:hypothetical protein
MDCKGQSEGWSKIKKCTPTLGQSGCYNIVPLSGLIINNLQFWKPGRSRSRHLQIQGLLRALWFINGAYWLCPHTGRARQSWPFPGKRSNARQRTKYCQMKGFLGIANCSVLLRWKVHRSEDLMEEDFHGEVDLCQKVEGLAKHLFHIVRALDGLFCFVLKHRGDNT